MAYFSLNDHPNAKLALQAVVMNPATPIEDRKYLAGPAMSLAAEANDNASVIQLGKIAIQEGAANSEVLGTLAISSYNMADYQNTLIYAQQGVDAAVKEKKVPQYALYQVMAFTYDKQKDRANELKSFELMARDYGKADDWKYLLDLSMEFLPQGNI